MVAMGGKKRPTISQLVKRQEREQQQAKPTIRKVTSEEKQQKVQHVDSKLIKDIEREIVKLSCVTPYTVASKFNIKVSTAYRILRELRDRGALQLVSKGHRVEVYAPPSRLKELGLEIAS